MDFKSRIKDGSWEGCALIFNNLKTDCQGIDARTHMQPAELKTCVEPASYSNVQAINDSYGW